MTVRRPIALLLLCSQPAAALTPATDPAGVRFLTERLFAGETPVIRRHGDIAMRVRLSSPVSNGRPLIDVVGRRGRFDLRVVSKSRVLASVRLSPEAAESFSLGLDRIGDDRPRVNTAARPIEAPAGICHSWSASVAVIRRGKVALYSGGYGCSEASREEMAFVTWLVSLANTAAPRCSSDAADGPLWTFERCFRRDDEPAAISAG